MSREKTEKEKSRQGRKNKENAGQEVRTRRRKRGSRQDEEGRTASIIALTMDAVGTSETSGYFNETTRRHIPEGFNLRTRRHENLKSHNVSVIQL
jgi:hypothetical protein